MRFLRPLLVLVMVVGGLTACDLFEEPMPRDRTWPSIKLEFFPLTESVTEPADSVGSVPITPEIQLIGKQRESDLNVTFTVEDSSTAVEGMHYRLPATSVVLPANSSETKVPIEVLDNAQDDGGATHELFLTITGNDGGVEIAENLKTFALRIQGMDEE